MKSNKYRGYNFPTGDGKNTGGRREPGNTQDSPEILGSAQPEQGSEDEGGDEQPVAEGKVIPSEVGHQLL